MVATQLKKIPQIGSFPQIGISQNINKTTRWAINGPKKLVTGVITPPCSLANHLITSSFTELFTDLWHRHRHKPRDGRIFLRHFGRVLGIHIGGLDFCFNCFSNTQCWYLPSWMMIFLANVGNYTIRWVFGLVVLSKFGTISALSANG